MGKRIYSIPKPFSSSGEEKQKLKEKKSRLDRQSFDVYEDDFPEDNVEENLDDQDLKSYELEDVEIDPEDDENISDNSAFNESDEEKYGHHFDGDSSDEQDSDEENEDAVDISTLLDNENHLNKKLNVNAKDLLLSEDEEIDNEELPEFSDEASEFGEDSAMDLSNLVSSSKSEADFDIIEDKHETFLDETLEGKVNPLSDNADITLDDLVQNLANDSGFSKLQKQVSDMKKDRKRQMMVQSAVPLALQNKLDRQAASEVAKKDVGKWMGFIEKNRRAEHLEFPLEKETPEPFTIQSLDHTVPKTSFVQEINSILSAANVSNEKDLLKSEEALCMNALSPEEVKAHRDELRKMRSLLFYAEKKEKRAAKIKSKSYRRIMRKEKEKMKGDEEEEIEEVEKQRALERMSLRHKSGSKWAKSLTKRHHDEDQNSREAIIENLDKKEKLLKKIAGKDDSESEDDVADAQDLSEFTSDLKKPLEIEKGVFAMKFMKNAIEKNRFEAADRISELLGDEQEEHVQSTTCRGRFSFGDAQEHKRKFNTEKNSEDLEGNHSDERRSVSKRMKPTELELKKPPFEGEQTESTEETSWMSTTLKSIGLGTTKSLNSMKDSASQMMRKLGKETSKISKKAEALKFDIVNPEEKEEEDLVLLPKSTKVDLTSQKELINMVFANDQLVEAEFKDEKANEIEQDLPKEEQSVLPGWGSWSGTGMKNRNKRKKKVVYCKESKNDRKDAKKPNAIINENIDKKFIENYTVSKVPYPYQSSVQYELNTRSALGREWNSAISHKKFTKPRISTKLGLIIKPPTQPAYNNNK